MARATSGDLRRASAMLLVAIFLGAGCGSATGQSTQASTVVTAASTGTAARAQPVSSRSIRSGDSGIVGQAVAIICGGPSSEQGCARRPVIATIDILRIPSAQRIATIRTDSRGHFRRNLPPGTYELRAHTGGQSLWARVVTARVLPHHFKHTTIAFVPHHPLPVAPG